MTTTTKKKKTTTKKPSASTPAAPVMKDYDDEPTIKGGRVDDIEAVERIIEKAADDFRSLHFGGALERLVWDVMSPGCSPTEKNTRALIALICALEKVAQIASVNDWGLLCGQIKFYIYNWRDEGVSALMNYTRQLEDTLESEVSHAK